MTDHFATLDLPRRPWVDSDLLKDRFHQYSALHHPDRAGEGSTGQFAALNQAYTVLKNPAARLRHLLELEYPDALADQGGMVPTQLVDPFMKLATLQRELKAFVGAQSSSTAALTSALRASERFTQKMDWEKMLGQLGVEHERCLRLLQAEDDLWPQCDEGTGKRYALLMSELTYLGRWMDQLREGIVQLESLP